MEGKSSACAHLSPVGNIAAAACDTWSNESVQNIKMLSGMAPTCSMEQLSYDCRLMNTASGDGRAAALQLRDWLCTSDSRLDPQALILAPRSVVRIARAIVEAPTHYQAGRAAGLAAIAIMREAHADGRLPLPEREAVWLDRMESTLAELPESEGQFISDRLALADPSRFLPSEYGL
jgi:methanol--5-hydroxybenzimidazolylcobamide Co-methyltransferase